MGFGGKKSWETIKDDCRHIWETIKNECRHIWKNISFFRWAKFKNFKILLRKHLSKYAALFLALATVLREIVEHKKFADIFVQTLSLLSNPFAHTSAFSLILIHSNLVNILNKFQESETNEKILIAAIAILTLLTVAAAVWERVGAKLDVSEQEKRFAVGIKNLLTELEKYQYKIANSNPLEVENILTEFIDNVLKTASNTLCGNKLVHAGMITYYQNEKSLKLTRFTENSGYEPNLVIHLEKETENKGPAQTAFDNDAIAHMPNKNKLFGWFYEEKGEEDYEFKEFINGWTEPPPLKSKIFKSVISLPVASFAGENKHGKTQKTFHGVVNFTSDSDHFIPRDFSMASSFTSLIAQAFDIAKKISETSGK